MVLDSDYIKSVQYNIFNRTIFSTRRNYISYNCFHLDLNILGLNLKYGKIFSKSFLGETMTGAKEMRDECPEPAVTCHVFFIHHLFIG